MKKKKETIKVFSSVENTLRQMPKYNPYACGSGAHKSAKDYNRKKDKVSLSKMVRCETW